MGGRGFLSERPRSWLGAIMGPDEASSKGSAIPGTCSRIGWRVPAGGTRGGGGTFCPNILLFGCCEEAAESPWASGEAERKLFVKMSNLTITKKNCIVSR
jgi:hypothetical protein